eukprot:8102621-Pyramimonas_sp.AAC.1
MELDCAARSGGIIVEVLAKNVGCCSLEVSSLAAVAVEQECWSHSPCYVVLASPRMEVHQLQDLLR